MISIVQHIDQICVERMYLIQTRKTINNCTEFLVKGLLCEFHFSHVELSNSRDLIAGMDDLLLLLIGCVCVFVFEIVK